LLISRWQSQVKRIFCENHLSNFQGWRKASSSQDIQNHRRHTSSKFKSDENWSRLRTPVFQQQLSLTIKFGRLPVIWHMRRFSLLSMSWLKWELGMLSTQNLLQWHGKTPRFCSWELLNLNENFLCLIPGSHYDNKFG
jgi:hypothetical protein